MNSSENIIKRPVNRRSFMKSGVLAGGATALAAGVVGKGTSAFAEERSGRLEPGDASILRFLAALETIETDLWQQYAELGGDQTNEPPQITGLTGGNAAYIRALQNLDGDMPQYIHDNTEDEFSHQAWINAYLASKGADTADLSHFRNLPSSQATGAQNIGRLTNLMELTIDTSWWTRYRSRTGNPDLGDSFANAFNVFGTKKHTAIPRNNNEAQLDSSSPNGVTDVTQYIANAAGLHFAFIEQGGTSLYAQLAQRVSHPEVLRILLSIGGTEIMHFQTWHDKAGNCPPLTGVKDPVSGDTVDFPDISTFKGNEDLQGNLIMPEPTAFLNRKFPPVSIIRPTDTKGAARGAVKALTDDGLFIGQDPAFFRYLNDLAEDADEARRRD